MCVCCVRNEKAHSCVCVCVKNRETCNPPFVCEIEKYTTLSVHRHKPGEFPCVHFLSFPFSICREKCGSLGTSLVGQWFRPHTPNAGGMALIPGRGTKITHGKKKKSHQECFSLKRLLPHVLTLNSQLVLQCPVYGDNYQLWVPALCQAVPVTSDPA